MGTTLRDWHPKGTTIHKVRIKRTVDGTEIGYGDVVRYAAGTVCNAVLHDPERPGMVDLQLPNGKLVRVALYDVEVIEE